MSQQQLKAEFDIRPATMEDIPFIFSSWLKSYRDAPAVQNVPNTVYYSQHHIMIQKILSSQYLYLRVACDKEDANHVYGYIVGEKLGDVPILHWVYCKYPFRNCHIATVLYKDLVGEFTEKVQYTHAGKIAAKLSLNKSASYNPYIVWSQK